MAEWNTSELSVTTLRPFSGAQMPLPLAVNAAGPSAWSVEFVSYPPFVGALTLGDYVLRVSGSITLAVEAGHHSNARVRLHSFGSEFTVLPGVVGPGSTETLHFENIPCQGTYGIPIGSPYTTAVELAVLNADDSEGISAEIMEVLLTFTVSDAPPGPDPDPEPVECFWTDVVGATQVCGGDTPEPPDGVTVSAVSTYNGSSTGAFIYNSNGCLVDMSVASALQITGYAVYGPLAMPIDADCGGQTSPIDIIKVNPPAEMAFEDFLPNLWNTDYFHTISVYGTLVVRASVDGGPEFFMLLPSSPGF